MRALLTTVAVTVLYGISGTIGTRQFTKKGLHARQVEAARRWYSNPPRETSTSTVKNITFSNPKVSGSFLSLHSSARALMSSYHRILCGWN
jgi:hypothetical protein